MTFKHPATSTGWSLFNATSPAEARTAINANLGIDVRDHGAVGDAVAIHLAGTTVGSAVVTSPDDAFTADMVGKTIVISGANADDSALITTVASYQGPGQITMAAPAGKVSSLIRTNAVVGTDNSAAFSSAFVAAKAEMNGSISQKQWMNIKPVFVPPGNYLTVTGVPTLTERGHSLVGAGFASSQIWHCGPGPFLEMGAFNSSSIFNPSTMPWYGLSWGLKVSNLSLHAPVFARDQVTSRRVGVGIQDNGSGHLFVEQCWISGFNYGIFATTGSDFTEISSNVAILDCNVGIYFGPSSQQISMHGPLIIGRNREGIVVDGAPNGIVTGASIGDNAIADVVFEGSASGLTRAGMPASYGGYLGPWTFLNCWFESASAGEEDKSGPQHILIDVQRTQSGGKTDGWLGLTFQDCYLVSGGTQTSGDTKAFVHDKSLYSADPTIRNLLVVGKRINTIYRYSGPAATFSPKIEGLYVYHSNDIATFMGPSGVASVETNLPGVITSPTRLTLSKINIDNATITRPRVDAVLDSNGYRSVEFETTLPTSTNENLINRWKFRNATTNSTPGLLVIGSDADISANIFCKGSGAIRLRSDTNNIAFTAIARTFGVNYLSAQSSTAGNPAELYATNVGSGGTDTNIGINLRPAGSGIVSVNGVPVVRRNIQTVTAATTLGSNGDYVVFISGANGNVTLPTSVGNTGRYTLKNIHTENKTVSTTSGQTIDGGTLTILPGDSVDVISDGTTWRIV